MSERIGIVTGGGDCPGLNAVIRAVAKAAASHQTGWTGIIARAMHMFATSTAEQALELGRKAALVETESPWSGQLAGAGVKRRV